MKLIKNDLNEKNKTKKTHKLTEDNGRLRYSASGYSPITNYYFIKRYYCIV